METKNQIANINTDFSKLIITYYEKICSEIFQKQFSENISDYRTLRRIKRMIQESAEVASESLERLFLNEKLEEDFVELILTHLEKPFTDGLVNIDAISKHKGYPDRLAEHLLNTTSCSRVLKTSGLEDIYSLAMKGTCQSLCLLSVPLIEWSQKNFPIKFPLLDKIISKFSEISKRIDALGAAGIGTEDQRFEREYLDYLLQRFSLVETGTLRMTTNIGTDLRTIYVDPKAIMLESDKNEKIKLDTSQELLRLEAARKSFSEKDTNKFFENEKRDIAKKLPPRSSLAINLIKKNTRIVVLGFPGSGKSMLTGWLLLSLAEGKIDFGVRKPHIPILLRIRELINGKKLPSVDDMIYSSTESAELSRRRPGWLAEKLTRGEIVFILDGLDETTIENRDQFVLPWLKNLVLRYPKNHYIVTSRPMGYPRGWLNNIDFKECRLQDFGEKEVKLYLKRWCTAVRMAQGENPKDAKKNGNEDGINLLKRIEENFYVRNLAKNPLMLSAICLVQFFKHGHLPDQRALLYKWCVEGLIHEWDERRGIHSEYDLDEKLRIVREVALSMQKQGLAEYPRKQVEEVFSSVLGDRKKALLLLDHIRFRSGILLERRANIYGFAHLTFQEYLAALAIHNGNSLKFTPNNLAENYLERKWMEVIPLYCGLTTDINAKNLIGKLLRKDPSDELSSIIAHAVAAADKKITKQLRKKAIRFCVNCPSTRRSSSLELFSSEEVILIAKQELGKAKSPFLSIGYYYLSKEKNLDFQPKEIEEKIRDISNYSPYGAAEFVHILFSLETSYESKVKLIEEEKLNLIGPDFSDGKLFYPSLAWIALFGLSATLRNKENIRNRNNMFRLISQCLNIILNQPIPKIKQLGAINRVLIMLRSIRWKDLEKNPLQKYQLLNFCKYLKKIPVKARTKTSKDFIKYVQAINKIAIL